MVNLFWSQDLNSEWHCKMKGVFHSFSHACGRTHTHTDKNSRLSSHLISDVFPNFFSPKKSPRFLCPPLLSNLPALKKGVSCLSTLSTRRGRVSLCIAYSTQAINECLLNWCCYKSIKFYQHRAEFMRKITLPRRVHFLSKLLVFLTY